MSDQKNAATWYQRAFEQFGRLTHDEQNAIFEHNPAEPPPAELRAALAKVEPVFTLFQRGAMLEHSDFGLDFSEGIAMLAPHLTGVRQIARAMATDAAVRLHDGDSATASQRLAHIYRASAHYGDDCTVISSLVGGSVFAIADRAVQRAMDHGAFGTGEAAVLLKELQRLQEMGDPFNFTGAAGGDQVLIVNWIDGVMDIEDPGERLEQFGTLVVMDDDEPPSPYLEQIAAMDRAEFEVAVDQFDAMTDRVIEIMVMDDPEAAKAAMAQLGEEIRAGEHGPLGMLSSHWGSVLDRKLRIEEMLAMRLESLREIVEEEVQPEEVANAAVWYGRAIEMLGRFEPEDLDLLRAFAAEEEVEADEDDHTAGKKLEPLLLLSQNIIDVLRDGSLKRRCDFSIIWTHVPGPAPSYTPGMRDLFRLVHADALRLMRLKKFDDAAERFAIGYRMIAHLSGDPHVVSSLVSHRAHLEAHELLEAALDAQHFGDDERGIVLSAFERIDAGDPFGYLASHRDLRAMLQRAAEMADREREVRAGDAATTAQAPAGAPDVEETDLPSSAEVVHRADDDALLYYLALIRYSHPPHTELLDDQVAARAQANERARLDALHDVLDLDELMEARAEAPEFGKRWRDYHGPMFHGYTPRSVNRLSDRRPSARADLRVTSRLLRQSMMRVVDEATGED